MYVININSHVLLSFLCYFVVPLELFWTTGCGFNKCSYYCYLFRSGPVFRLLHHHCHVWVRCFETTNIIFSSMSSIAIHVPYFYFYIILSSHSRCSETWVVSRYLPIFSALQTVSSFIQVKNTTYQKLSAISWKF